jgi:uncharacterized protein (UPF0548 family)
VSVQRLPAPAVAKLQHAPFTYEPVGCTAGAPPPGFAELRRTHTLTTGADFAKAAHALLAWQVHLRAGLRVEASSSTVERDAVVVLRACVGPLSLNVPCRVVYVVDESDRQGFAYGTLPGHPESGEEAFVIERSPDGRIDFTITAFSRPATTLARLGGPVTGWVQRVLTTRYLRSLDT